MRLLSLLSFVLVVATAGCLQSFVGQTCDESDANCVYGATCTRFASKRPVCRWECEDDADCGSEETCVDVNDGSGLSVCLLGPMRDN